MHRTCPRLLLSVLVLACAACSSGGADPTVTIFGVSFLGVGDSAQFQAVTLHAADHGYEWTCSDPDVATVSDQGLVTARGEGEAVIRATGLDTGRTGEAAVTILDDGSQALPVSALWADSAHGDSGAASFHHWDDEWTIPTDCAKCHHTDGFRDYVGADGSAAGRVDAPVPAGGSIACAACHNGAAAELDPVLFASGAAVAHRGRDARCEACHQGLGCAAAVDERIARTAPPSDDQPVSGLEFVGVHGGAAAATRHGCAVQGGYEYPERSYDARFGHVSQADGCTDCHDPHSLAVATVSCAPCHPGVGGVTDARDLRTMSSRARDYDGDGDLDEGVAMEIAGLHALLLQAIRAYAADVAGAPVAYDGSVHPFWFRDTVPDGIADPAEAVAENRYDAWTARLMRAAYNYDLVARDRGGFAHNAKYLIQLLHDSIADLNRALPAPVDLTQAVRDDAGHFDGASRSFRHWDLTGHVPATCAKCHAGAAGYVEFLDAGANTAQEPANGLDCASCHERLTDLALRRVESVAFPGGWTTPPLAADAAAPDVHSNLCIVCHCGRASKATLEQALAQGDDSFQGVHNLPAAAVLFGTDAQVGYEYPAKSYADRWGHTEGAGCSACHGGAHGGGMFGGFGGFGRPPEVDWWTHSSGPVGNQCVICHDPMQTSHGFGAAESFSMCRSCHKEADSLHEIRRVHLADYDGDGNAAEPLAGELETLGEALLDRIRTVAAANGAPIAHDPDVDPHFFRDLDGDGTADPDETEQANRYDAWTPGLLRAAHNYQLHREEPGAWAHNFAYVAQLLVDSIEDLGGETSGLVRP